MNETAPSYTEEDYDRLQQIFVIGESVLALFSFTLNCTVIAVFRKLVFNNKSKLSNFVFLIQALTDIVVTVALSISALAPLVPATKELYTIWVFFLEYSQFLSLNTLFLITGERFLAVKFPYIHRACVTIKKIGFASVFIFVLSAMPALAGNFFILPLSFAASSQHEEEHYLSLLMIYHVAMGSITILIILCVFLMLLSSYSSIKSSFRLRIRYHLTASFNQHERVRTEKKRERKMIKILLSMCAVYTVTYLPFALTRICYRPFLEHILPRFIGEGIIHACALFYFLTSFSDPLTTLLFKDDYSYAVVQWYKFLRGKLFTSAEGSLKDDDLSRQSTNEAQLL